MSKYAVPNIEDRIRALTETLSRALAVLNGLGNTHVSRGAGIEEAKRAAVALADERLQNSARVLARSSPAAMATERLPARRRNSRGQLGKISELRSGRVDWGQLVETDAVAAVGPVAHQDLVRIRVLSNRADRYCGRYPAGAVSVRHVPSSTPSDVPWAGLTWNLRWMSASDARVLARRRR